MNIPGIREILELMNDVPEKTDLIVGKLSRIEELLEELVQIERDRNAAAETVYKSHE